MRARWVLYLAARARLFVELMMLTVDGDAFLARSLFLALSLSRLVISSVFNLQMSVISTYWVDIFALPLQFFMIFFFVREEGI